MQVKHFIALIGAIVVAIGVIVGYPARVRGYAHCGSYFFPGGPCGNPEMTQRTILTWALTIVGLLIIIGALFVKWRKAN